MSPTTSPPSPTKSSKAALQIALVDKYKINKNISKDLTGEECRQLLELLAKGSIGLEKLLTAYAEKNDELGKNNRALGCGRKAAENKANKLQQEYQELQSKIEQIKKDKANPVNLKQQTEKERRALEEQISGLTSENQQLADTVKEIDTEKEKLIAHNDELKKDNKRLKNLVDAIRLTLSLDVKDLLKKEDGELRKSIAKLYNSILG
jgi:DNA repair exonuclease SbcCD ATPase subunit